MKEIGVEDEQTHLSLSAINALALKGRETPTDSPIEADKNKLPVQYAVAIGDRSLGRIGIRSARGS